MEQSTAMEPARTTTLQQKPVFPAEQAPEMDPGELTAMSYAETEAAVSLALDRIKALTAIDPLEGLSQMLGLLQGVNIELIKAYAPVLMHNAQRKSDAFLQEGKVLEDKREGNRTMVTFLRIQEATAKLGIAQVKVNDEKERRAQPRNAKPAGSEPIGEHRLPPLPDAVEVDRVHEPIGAGGESRPVRQLSGPPGEWTLLPKPANHDQTAGRPSHDAERVGKAP